MKKLFVNKTVTVVAALSLAAVMMTGCGAKEAAAVTSDEPVAEEAAQEEVKTQEAAEANAEIPGAPYFTKGVYVNYAKEAELPPLTYFYVFNAEDHGYTADGAAEGIGVPFSVEQKDGEVNFSFGGEDSIEDVLTITSAENGMITGHFDDGLELVFELISALDPDTFNAENYVNGPEMSVYRDANGWSIKYNADQFEITPQGPQTFIVYTGESAGTNMITVTYTVENKGEAAIKALGESWGSDKVTYSESEDFPGAEGVKTYRAALPADTEGSGLYYEALGRDYMDGALIFEVTGHMGNDEEMNMATSDALAGIIDSLEFETN